MKNIVAKKTKRLRPGQIILHLVIIFLLFCTLYPLGMAVWGSFKPSYIYDETKLWPTLPLRWSNYVTAWKSIYSYVWNTLYVGLIGTFGSLILASLSSYAFSLMEFPGKKILFSMIISLMMIPGVLTLIPSFAIYRNLGLLNSHLALILPVIVGGPVGGAFLLNSFIQGLPKELIDAAKIDGANHLQCYSRVVVPLCIPILSTMGINTFMGTWNDYLWPTIVIHDHEKLTIAAGMVLNFSGTYASNFPVTYAGYVLAAIPLIILFVYNNKSYIQGLLNSGVKF